MPLRIATIGRNGQVAQALASVADPDIALTQASRTEADLRDPHSLARFIDAARPEVLINAGAYNFVDRAETERDPAYAINADGPRALATLCRQRGIALIHMSTDCVFDGEKSGAYDEDDAPNPLSVYGQSKLAGERAVIEADPDAVIVRVCWVFSGFGDNFVSKMIALARERAELRVVDDQVGPPTFAPDIARGLIALARARRATPALQLDLLHLAAPGAMDRAAMARAIMAESARQGGPSAAISPVSTANFAAPAARPLNAQLSGDRATRLFGLRWTPWQEALQLAVSGVLARG